MKTFTLLKRAARYAVAATVAGLMLSACAAAGPDTANGCVGPPSFCQPYFGS